MQTKYLPTKQIYNISDDSYFQESYKKKEKLDLYSKLRGEGCCQKTTLDRTYANKPNN